MPGLNNRQGGGYLKNRALLLSTNPPCWLCGGEGADSADHVVPWSQGGSHALSNLRPAHLACNNRRKDKPAHLTNFRPDSSGAW